jgi:hypothetical protein
MEAVCPPQGGVYVHDVRCAAVGDRLGLDGLVDARAAASAIAHRVVSGGDIPVPAGLKSTGGVLGALTGYWEHWKGY